MRSLAAWLAPRVVVAGTLAAAMAPSIGAPPAAPAAVDVDAGGERPGGAATVDVDGRHAFSMPAANLPDAERARFAIGNSFFRRNWVEAPSSTRARDGLGPHFIARSCGGCHVQDGRGAPPDVRRGRHDAPVSLLLRLSVPGQGEHGAPRPEPTYGDQFTNAAVQGVPREGDVTLAHRRVRGRFADGTPYELLAPRYGFANLAHGPMAPGTQVSPRVAPQLAGVGLIESIPDAEIDRNASDQASAGGPVRGVPNRVWDAHAGRTMIGRFGWKANVATLAHQTEAAFVGDMGITSTRFAREACTSVQRACAAARRGGAPEIDDRTLADVVFYQAVLAPPARADAGDAVVRRGARLFAQAQCAACHRPSYVTGDGPFPALTSKALSGQRIWPYTDLLLHDMGEALADGRPDFLAGGRQWKTPPLWGIGRIPQVNGHRRLLHDGRARGVMEAILWHGGEAQGARERVLRLSKQERDALVRFVESL